jgi:hypothetical protein
MPLFDYAKGNIPEAFRDENLETGYYASQAHLYKRVPPEQRQNVSAELYRRTFKVTYVIDLEGRTVPEETLIDPREPNEILEEIIVEEGW